MGNHDVYNMPEDLVQETREQAFQNEAKALHDKIMNWKGIREKTFLHSLNELARLLNMPAKIHKYDVPKYSKEDMKLLREMGKRIR